LDIYSASSLKQQTVEKTCRSNRTHYMTSSQQVSTLTSDCYALKSESTNANFTVYGLTSPRLEHMIYRIRGEHAPIAPPMRSRI